MISDHPKVSFVFMGSMVAMLLWPIIAFGLGMAGSIFEQWNDFILLFGGVTLLFLIPIGLLVDPPEWFVVVTICSVWVIAFAVPVLLAASQKLSKGKLFLAYVLQAVFSLTQAALGILMLAGRHV